MANQQQFIKITVADLLDLSRRAFVWISKEDQRKAEEFRKTSKSGELEEEGKETAVFACDYCHKKFLHKQNLRQHVKIHTGQKIHHCSLCDFSTLGKGNLETHIRRRLNERPFKCQEPNCEASFASPGKLTRHQLVHNKKDKRFSCSACPFKTHSKSCLTQHKKNMHSESTLFKCPHENCDYSAKMKGNFNQHLKIHSKEKNEVCPHPNCGFKTNWPAYLKRHLEIHSSKEKRYKCHFCEYSCHHHGSLVVHIRRHTGETPFACHLCSFKSKDRSHLKYHLKSH